MNKQTMNNLIEKHYIRGVKKQKNITLLESTIALIDNLSEALSINRNEIINVAIMEFFENHIYTPVSNNVIQPAALETPEPVIPQEAFITTIEPLENGRELITERYGSYSQSTPEQMKKEQDEIGGARCKYTADKEGDN